MHLPELIAAPTPNSVCASCEQPAKNGCGGCEQVAYCTQEHQEEHWGAHKEHCKAYKVLRNDAVGRYGVSTRTLDPGDVILTETPVVVGPKPETYPLCLGCYVPVDCTVLCSHCGWPVCSEACEQASCHAKAECLVFAGAQVRFQPIEDWSVSCPQYECITPLRLLLSKETKPDRWEKEVQHMEAHNEARKKTEFWSANQVNTVDFLRKACKLTERFSEEEIHTACGILEVNCFEIRCANGSSVRGLYPQTAIMSHSCVANTTHSISLTGVEDADEEYRLRLRASVKVERGEELFTSYASSMESTLIRREKLRTGKYFDCRCRRCADPTELGTHLGSLKCSKCDNGVVLSTDPLDATAQWKCTHCEFTTRGEAVRRMLAVVQGEIDQLEYLEPSTEAVEAFEHLFRKYRSVLHPRHSCMTSLRHSLAHLYGRIDGYLLDDLPDILLERKIELCRQLLAVADVVEPGFTRLRAMTLYEIHAPLLSYAQSQCRLGVLKEEKLKVKLEEVESYLEEAVSILRLEDPNTLEGMLARMSQESLEQLRDSIQSLAVKADSSRTQE